MTAGEALKRDNVAGYNCSYVSANKPKSFDEILYILMCGTGVGFSVEREFIKTLPTIAEFEDSDTTIIVQDSKMGWAKAYRELFGLSLLEVKFQNGTRARFALPMHALRLLG